MKARREALGGERVAGASAAIDAVELPDCVWTLGHEEERLFNLAKTKKRKLESAAVGSLLERECTLELQQEVVDHVATLAKNRAARARHEAKVPALEHCL